MAQVGLEHEVGQFIYKDVDISCRRDRGVGAAARPEADPPVESVATTLNLYFEVKTLSRAMVIRN